jgi:predicted Zn-dependent protease
MKGNSMDAHITRKIYFRSEGRKINQDDDMVRFTIDVKRIDEIKFISRMEEQGKTFCEWDKEDMHFTNPHNGTRTYCIGKYCSDCGKEIKVI